MKTELKSFEEAREVVTRKTSDKVELPYKFQCFSQVQYLTPEKQKFVQPSWLGEIGTDWITESKWTKVF